MGNAPGGSDNVSEHGRVPEGDDDVVTDPHLDDPRDDEASEEGVSSDWTGEGGAMPEGPATDAPAGTMET